MRRFIKKYYIQLIVIACIAVLEIFGLYESYKIFVMIKSQSDILKQTQMDQVLAQEYLQNIHVFKKDAAYIHDNNGNFNILLPDNDDEKVRLFSTLENIAKETGNKDVVLAVTKKAKEEKADKKKVIIPQSENNISMTITLVGSSNDLIMFLRRVENMQFVSDVLSIKSVKTVDDNAEKKSEDDESDEPVQIRTDLLKSDITIVFYLDKINK